MVSDAELIKKITSFLKLKRGEAGLTQREVAEKFGYTTGQFVSNWERGLVMPPLSTVRKLAELYGVNLDDIYRLICEEVQRVVREQLYDEGQSGGQDAVADTSDGFKLKSESRDFLSNC